MKLILVLLAGVLPVLAIPLLSADNAVTERAAQVADLGPLRRQIEPDDEGNTVFYKRSPHGIAVDDEGNVVFYKREAHGIATDDEGNAVFYVRGPKPKPFARVVPKFVEDCNDFKKRI